MKLVLNSNVEPTLMHQHVWHDGMWYNLNWVAQHITPTVAAHWGFALLEDGLSLLRSRKYYFYQDRWCPLLSQMQWARYASVSRISQANAYDNTAVLWGPYVVIHCTIALPHTVHDSSRWRGPGWPELWFSHVLHHHDWNQSSEQTGPAILWSSAQWYSQCSYTSRSHLFVTFSCFAARSGEWYHCDVKASWIVKQSSSAALWQMWFSRKDPERKYAERW